MRSDHKTILAVFCAAVGGASALFFLWQGTLYGAAAMRDIPRGSWLSRWLSSWLSAQPDWFPAVWLAVFFLLLWFFCRHLVRFHGGTGWRDAAVIFGILAVLLPPARGLFTDPFGALTVTIPACFALAGLGSLLLSYSDGKHTALHMAAALVLILLGCGGHRFVAMILVAALATLNFCAALQRQSIVKTQIALTLSVVATTVNIFFSFDFT